MAFNYKVLKWGIEIDAKATIGKGFMIHHHGGIVINSKAVCGENLTISHGVTIGEDPKGQVPVIGNNVHIFPGAVVYGKIIIGDNVKIGANAVIHKSLPDNNIAVSPGFVILKG